MLGEGSLPLMREAFAGLETQARAWFEAEGIAPEARRLKRTVDMRYAGQNYELSIPLPEGEIGSATLDALAEGFAAAHRQRYGFVAEGETVQLVTYRAEATGVVRKAAFQPRPEVGPDASAARIGEREVWMPEAGGWTPCPSTTGRSCGPAMPSRARPSSSRWTPPPWCCPPWSPASNPI